MKQDPPPSPLDLATVLQGLRQADEDREQLRVSLETALEHIQRQDTLCQDLEERLCASRREVTGLTATLAGREAEVGRLKQKLREREVGGGLAVSPLSAAAEEELRSALEELQITAEELQHSNDLLCRVNEELEQRVAARTEDLVHSNTVLRKALIERDLLLREVHHRVRNNMQTILSLLRMQARRMAPQVHRDFGNALGRIHAMAVAQDQLYGVDDLSRIDFAAHLRSVTPLLLQAHGGDPERIRLDIAVCPCIIDLDTAFPDHQRDRRQRCTPRFSRNRGRHDQDQR